MKIVVSGDWHFDMVVRGYDPHADLLIACGEIVEACQGADLFVHLGDFFDGNRPSPRALAAVIRVLSDIASRCPVVGLRGNHDEVHRPPLQPDALEPLRAVPGLGRFPHVPEIYRYWGKNSAILLVPYISDMRARQITGLRAQEVVDRLFKIAVETESVVAAFSHLDVDGASVGTEGVTLRGGRLSLPALARVAPFTTYNGHIHKEQALGAVTMTGSVYPTDFSEADGEKAFLVVEV